MAKLNNYQKRLKLASLDIEKAENHLKNAVVLLAGNENEVAERIKLLINLEKLTELKESIWK